MTVLAAAAPPSPTLFARLEELNFRVVHVYGLTETYGPITVSPEPDGFAELDAAGRARVLARQGQAYPTADLVRVVDEHDADVPRDGATMGEVVMRGNNVMLGYHDDPEATAIAFRGGWFHSGDLAVWHPDGTIELRDRAKDVIISGGENISTIEVEQALASHPAVLECAVVAIPHERWGERPKAFVTLRDGAEVTAERADRARPRPHRPLQGARCRRVRPAAEDLDRQGAEVRAARSRVGRPRGAHQLTCGACALSAVVIAVAVGVAATGCLGDGGPGKYARYQHQAESVAKIDALLSTIPVYPGARRTLREEHGTGYYVGQDELIEAEPYNVVRRVCRARRRIRRLGDAAPPPRPVGARMDVPLPGAHPGHPPELRLQPPPPDRRRLGEG